MSTPRHGTLAGFIPWYFAKYASPVGLSADFFDRLLLGGGCLLMLDGLDEIVSGPERGWVKQQIEDLANHIYPGNRVMVTAREAGYRDNAVFGDDFLRVDVQDLDEDQIQVLVANWCAQLYPGEETQRTQELLSAIHDINNLRTHRELPPLINTPLMTTMVVSVKWGETELPRERAKLYEAAVKVILRAQYLHDDPERTELEKWGGSWEEQRDCLAILALAMHGEGRSGAVVTQARICEVLGQKLLPDNLESFLQAVRLRGGLLEERADLFQFAHLTFQEFLAAHWLAKQRDAAFPVLQPHLTDSWWREVFLLTYGVARVDFEPFAQQYLTWLSSQTVDGEARLAGLELAGSALLELEKPDPKRRRQQAKGLVEALGDPHLVASGGLRARAGNTLARLGDPRFREDAWYLPAEPLLGFVEIGAGPFLMGSDKAHDPEAYDNELPQHEVTLQRYFIGRYPVTVAQFRAFVEDSGHRPVDDASLEGLPNHPVVRVTWYEALKYCDWLTGQLREWPGMPEPLARLVGQEGWRITLPSEAEWEKAARGSDGRIYPWGNEPDPNRANYSDTGIRTTSAVGCFPGGISPYGVHELSGNVWEWTRSLWGEYPYPTDKSGQIYRESMDAGREEGRVCAGRGVRRTSSGVVRCAYRRWYNPYYPVLVHRVSGGGAPMPLSSDLCPSALWGSPEGCSPLASRYTTAIEP